MPGPDQAGPDAASGAQGGLVGCEEIGQSLGPAAGIALDHIGHHAMMTADGVALEINANPKDTADHENGVWALPPTLTNGEKDRAKYLAIGESDRMTLLFRKRA